MLPRNLVGMATPTTCLDDLATQMGSEVRTLRALYARSDIPVKADSAGRLHGNAIAVMLSCEKALRWAALDDLTDTAQQLGLYAVPVVAYDAVSAQVAQPPPPTDGLPGLAQRTRADRVPSSSVAPCVGGVRPPSPPQDNAS